MPVRKDRNRVLRELAAAKNAAFRESMVGREWSAVTMDPPGVALTDNFIKAQLDMPYSANRMVRLKATGCTEQGLRASVLGER